MKGFLSSIQNFWTGYSKVTEEYYEKKLIMEWGGLSTSNVKIGNMSVSGMEDDIIHYISIEIKNRTPFVFIPGYGASGAIYYSIIKELSDRYDLYLVDMRGMGG